MIVVIIRSGGCRCAIVACGSLLQPTTITTTITNNNNNNNDNDDNNNNGSNVNNCSNADSNISSSSCNDAVAGVPEFMAILIITQLAAIYTYIRGA